MLEFSVVPYVLWFMPWAFCISNSLSAFTNSTPFLDLIKLYSSVLVCITPSKEPKPSKCAFPMLVIIPKSGKAILHKKSISPMWLAPISIIAISAFDGMDSNVSGTPK